MPAREGTTYQKEHGSILTGASHPSPGEDPFLMGDETRDQVTESGAYTAQEEALVEERLKNLGYL